MGKLRVQNEKVTKQYHLLGSGAWPLAPFLPQLQPNPVAVWLSLKNKKIVPWLRDLGQSSPSIAVV